MSFFVMVGLLLCIQTPGSSAATPVFVEKGKDVLLEVMDNAVLKETDIMFWRFNQVNTLVRLSPGINPVIFSKRVSVKGFSLILKNLQAADSGVYEARVVGATERTIAEYSVTVQDTVSPVELKVDFVFISSDSCIVNGTCSTADSDISSSFRCVHQTCNQLGGEQSKTTNSAASLRISLSNGLIFCNHSNQVSWTKDMKEIQDFCQLDPDTVSPVELKVDFVFISSDSCIVNGTCSTADSDISSSFRCVHQTCNQLGGEQSKTTNSAASLRISLSNGLIFCNHSNQVSWTKDMKEIQDFCQLDPVPESLSICLVKTVVFSVGLVVMVSVVVSVHLMEKCKKQK